jgi:hypothetical protein
VGNTGGATAFGGAVGGVLSLASIATDAPGTTTLTGNVTTSGAQSYNDAVLLAGDVTASLIAPGPPFAMTAKVGGVDFNGLCTDFSKDLAGLIHGTLATTLDVRGRGLDTAGLRSARTATRQAARRCHEPPASRAAGIRPQAQAGCCSGAANGWDGLA